jgi:hypothetical protein
MLPCVVCAGEVLPREKAKVHFRACSLRRHLDPSLFPASHAQAFLNSSPSPSALDHLFVLESAPIVSASTTQYFSDYGGMAEFTNLGWHNEGIDPFDPSIFEDTSFLWNGFPITPPDNTTNSNTPSSPDFPTYKVLEKAQIQNPKKRRQTSGSPQPDTLVRPKKPRRLIAPHETAKIRVKGACLLCKRKRKNVRPICEFLVLSRAVQTNIEIVPRWRPSRWPLPALLGARRQDNLHPWST